MPVSEDTLPVITSEAAYAHPAWLWIFTSIVALHLTAANAHMSVFDTLMGLNQLQMESTRDTRSSPTRP
jgi:cytochrome b561